MDKAGMIPEHIAKAAKAFSWDTSRNEARRNQMAFVDFIDNNSLYHGHEEFNSSMYELLESIEYYPVSYLDAYLRPDYKDGMITGYTSYIDIFKKKRQTMKAGKYLKKIFPFLDSSQIEKLVSNLKAMHSPLEFELIECGLPESFEYAYKTPHVPRQSPRFNNGKDYCLKQLCVSCMRGENFTGWNQHPAVVYGYGDLRILYAKEKHSGNIGARVILFPANKSASSIYTANDAATELLVNYLESNDYSADGIEGAKVSKIHKRGDEYLMPYIDDCENAKDCGDYFLLGSGQLSCRSTDGTMTLEELTYCDDCGESYPDENMTTIDDSCVCAWCRSDNYTYSDLMDEWLSNDEAESDGDGSIATSDYFESHGYVRDCDCTWQVESDCIEFDGEYYHYRHWAIVSFDGKHYHEDSEELTKAKEEKEALDKAYQVKTSTQLDWKLDRTEYNPTPYLALITTKERTLRDNYQLDANGNPERLPEFDFA